MLKWSHLRFLLSQKLVLPSLIVFLFGHLILLNEWIELIFPNLLSFSEEPSWFFKLTNTAVGKIFLIYLSSVFFSMSVLIARVSVSDMIRDFSSVDYLMHDLDNFFERNPNHDALIKNELNFFEARIKRHIDFFENAYVPISDKLSKGLTEPDRKRVVVYLYEVKDQGLYFPWISGFLFLTSVAINAYLSMAIFINVIIASVQLLTS